MAEAKQQEAEGNVPEAGDLPPPYQPSYGTTEPVPPTYEQAQAPQDAPPSYEDLFGQVRAAKTESSSVVDFLKKVLVIVLGTIGCSICVGLILAIPIAMIVIGSKYLHDCPREKYIPIYLIVGGCFGVLKNVSNMVQRVLNRKENRDDENSKTNPGDGILNCFLIAWFIAGNVWIYRILNDFNDSDPEAGDYCNPTLYWFAFWLTTATYIIIGLSCCCICCCGVMASLADKAGSPASADSASARQP